MSTAEAYWRESLELALNACSLDPSWHDGRAHLPDWAFDAIVADLAISGENLPLLSAPADSGCRYTEADLNQLRSDHAVTCRRLNEEHDMVAGENERLRRRLREAEQELVDVRLGRRR